MCGRKLSFRRLLPFQIWHLDFSKEAMGAIRKSLQSSLMEDDVLALICKLGYEPGPMTQHAVLLTSDGGA